MGRVKLKKDIVIPAGTVFEGIDGLTVDYGSGNYDYTFGLTKDTVGSLIYGVDTSDLALGEWFEECE
jgi:hypothetical protein